MSNQKERRTRFFGYARMHLKLKYVLPFTQMLVAAALLLWTDRWERALMRIQDMPGTPPSFGLLIAINAPLAVPRALVFRYLPGPWDDIALVVMVGIFWYWVALSVGTWRQGRRILMFSWMPLRLVADVAAAGTGVMWSLFLWRDFALWHWYGFSGSSSSTAWLWTVPCTVLPILWSLALILLFGRDFVQCARTTKPRPCPNTLKST